MTVYYLDSSAWVKRYLAELAELGSTWVLNLFRQQEVLACCPLGYIEVSAAIARQQDMRKISSGRLGILRSDVLTDWNEMVHAPLDSAVIELGAKFAGRISCVALMRCIWPRPICCKARLRCGRLLLPWSLPI